MSNEQVAKKKALKAPAGCFLAAIRLNGELSFTLEGMAVYSLTGSASSAISA
jgi:hypothetical protein